MKKVSRIQDLKQVIIDPLNGADFRSESQQLVVRLIRLCRRFLKDLSYTAGYFDDVLIHSEEWNSHLSHHRNVFLAILKAGMKSILKNVHMVEQV